MNRAARPITEFVKNATASGAGAHPVPGTMLRSHVTDVHGFKTREWAWDMESAKLLGLDPWQGDLHRVSGAVVMAHAGVVETGQVVVGHHDRRPREWTLIIPTLVLLLPADRVVPDLSSAAAMLNLEPGHTWVFVRGPSATADIEKRIVRGVHGPQRVAVCVLTP